MKEDVWLPQKMKATRYDVRVVAINKHVKKIYDYDELSLEFILAGGLK